MGINAQGGVSIVELVLYIPCLILTLIICARHGSSRSSGWRYTVILCLARLVGAVCQLLTYSNSSTGLIEATFILESIGLSPLILAALGLISRFVHWINIGSPHPKFSAKYFRILQLLIGLGTILCVVGGTNTKPAPDGTVNPPTTSQAGIILLIVALIGCALLLGLSSTQMSLAPKTEHAVPIAVAVALLFTASRLTFSVLVTFVHDDTFSLSHGSLGVRIGMALIPEFIVIIIYIILGFKLARLPVEDQEPSSRLGKPLVNGRRTRRRHGPHAEFDPYSSRPEETYHPLQSYRRQEGNIQHG